MLNHFAPDLFQDRHRIDPPATLRDGSPYFLDADLTDRAISYMLQQAAPPFEWSRFAGLSCPPPACRFLSIRRNMNPIYEKRRCRHRNEEGYEAPVAVVRF